MALRSGHGGKRAGSGRPSLRGKTERIRLPLPIYGFLLGNDIVIDALMDSDFRDQVEQFAQTYLSEK